MGLINDMDKAYLSVRDRIQGKKHSRQSPDALNFNFCCLQSAKNLVGERAVECGPHESINYMSLYNEFVYAKGRVMG